MAFWDNLSHKASETTAKAVQKAKDISDIARLNSMISEEEANINNIYYQVGKLYVAMHPHDHEEEFSGMIATLEESNGKIANYKQQVQDIKGLVRCPQCGAEVQSSVTFCSNCGASMPKVEMKNTDDLMCCEGCGAMIKKDVRFCTSCGKPIVQVVETETATKPVLENETSINVCPNCGSKNEAGFAFCVECGTKL